MKPQVETSIEQQMQPDRHAAIRKYGQAILGVGMLGVVAAGVAEVVQNEDLLNKNIAISFDNAQPSDSLSTAFDILGLLGAGTGAVVIAKRGVHKARTSVNPADTALYSMAHGSQKKSRARVFAAATLLTSGAGIMTGNYLDVAASVGSAQADVGEFMTQAVGAEDGVMFTNTDRPELANTATVKPEIASAISKAAFKENRVIIPARYEWHPAVRPSNPEAKLQVLAIGLPGEVTGLKPANSSCTNVEVAAAKEVGIPKGANFTVDGLEVKVAEVLENSAGTNLLPVVFSNEDFARCINTNPNQPFNALLSDMSFEEAKAFLKNNRIGNNTAANRIFAVPTDRFIAESLQTGKNSVNGLVLQAMALGLLFGGVALSSRVSNELVNNRENNRMLKVNGFSERMIAKLYTEKAEADAIQSSLLAVPGIILIDTFTNSGLPGAALGPSAKTYLAVVGFTWGVKRIGTSIAVRKERGIDERTLGQNQ